MPPKAQVAAANKNTNNNNHHQKGLLQVNPAAVTKPSNKSSPNPAAVNKPSPSPVNKPSPSPVNKPSPSPAKSPSTVRLKLSVRRLPPGLTQHEFLDAFGDEWKPAAGKVDWFAYRTGKTQRKGKVAEQSRAYVHLVSQHLIKDFETKFLSITFIDAKGTHKDPTLKNLQPCLEFAPNQRTPANKQRQDGRQGTIDQDPEFIAFLERETMPITKPQSLDAAQADKPPHEKVQSTPLLDDLREKKANRSKPTSSKSVKPSRPEPKEDKPTSSNSRQSNTPAKPINSATKPVNPVKDAVKIANRQATKNVPATTSTTPIAALSQPSAALSKADQQPPASPASGRKQRERVTPDTIKSMLQRDLGIAAPPPGKRSAKNAAAGVATTPAASIAAPSPSQSRSATPISGEASQAKSKSEAAVKPAKPARTRKVNAADKPNGQPPAQETAKPTAPAPEAILKKTPATPPSAKEPKLKPNAKANRAPVPRGFPTEPSFVGATKAYLKHANASQGITEPLIIAALSSIGEVVKVDIDERKGTALAEFKSPESLKAAMRKRTIPIAQGAVEILEYRERSGPGMAGRLPPGGRAANPPAATRNAGGSVRGKAKGGRGATAASTAAAPVANGVPAPTNAT